MGHLNNRPLPSLRSPHPSVEQHVIASTGLLDPLILICLHCSKANSNPVHFEDEQLIVTLIDFFSGRQVIERNIYFNV